MEEKEQRLRDEIIYWTHEQEIDKFNYSQNLATLFAFTAILLSLTQVVTNYKRGDIAGLTIFSIVALIVSFFSLYVYYKNSDTNHHFYVRNVMIEEMYGKIYRLKKGEFKEGLNEDFRKEKRNLDRILRKKMITIVLTAISIVGLVLIIILI